MIADAQLPDQPGAYLIHFDEPLCHAKNYLGSAQSLRSRIADQGTDRGARIVAAVQAKAEAEGGGPGWRVARIWPTPTHEAAVQTEIGLKTSGRRGGSARTAHRAPPTPQPRRWPHRDRPGHHPPVRKAPEAVNEPELDAPWSEAEAG